MSIMLLQGCCKINVCCWIVFVCHEDLVDYWFRTFTTRLAISCAEINGNLCLFTGTYKSGELAYFISLVVIKINSFGMSLSSPYWQLNSLILHLFPFVGALHKSWEIAAKLFIIAFTEIIVYNRIKWPSIQLDKNLIVLDIIFRYFIINELFHHLITLCHIVILANIMWLNFFFIKFIIFKFFELFKCLFHADQMLLLLAKQWFLCFFVFFLSLLEFLSQSYIF